MQMKHRRIVVGSGLAALAVLLSALGPLQAQPTWRGLKVEPERRCSPYDSDQYRYSQSVEDRIIADHGGVYSPYTGRWFSTKRETDIEHMVARSEAHDSGLCAADLATRRRFAGDLLNLTLASPFGQSASKDCPRRGGLDARKEPLLVCSASGSGAAAAIASR